MRKGCADDFHYHRKVCMRLIDLTGITICRKLLKLFEKCVIRSEREYIGYLHRFYTWEEVEKAIDLA